MMWRRISLMLGKYITIGLCLVTILLTTPWGTRLALALLNNFDSVTIGYHSGSLVRDVQLNTFHLDLENLDISVNGLTTQLDFSCVWKKTLCIKSAHADEFYLHYTTEEKGTKNEEKQKGNIKSLLEMPFAIKADSIGLEKSHLVINNVEISISQLIAQVVINKSEFKIIQPSANQLTVFLEAEQRSSATNQSPVSSDSTFAKLPEIDLPISLIIEKLTIDDILAGTKKSQEKHEQLWQSSKNQLSGVWVHTMVSISHMQTITPTFSINSFNADAKLQPPYQINTQFISHLKDIPWWPEIDNTTQHFSLQGSLENLAFEVNSQGSLALTSQGKVDLVNKELPFNITVEAEKIPMPLSLTHYGKPSSLNLIASGSLKEQAIELTSQLNSYGYNNAQVKLLAKHQQGHFKIDELLFYDNDSASQLDLNGDLSLLQGETSWQLSAHSTGISLPQISLQRLTEMTHNQEELNSLDLNIPNSLTGRVQGKVTSTGTWSEKHWRVSIEDTDISGKINNADLNIKGDIGVNNKGHLEQGKLLVAFNNSQLSLQTSNNSFWDLNGHLSVDNLNQWYQGLNGAFVGDFSIVGEKHNPIIRLNSLISKLNWQHWHSNNLKIEGTYQPTKNHQTQLSLSNDQLKFINENKIVNIDDFSLSVVGDASNHQIQTHWLGDFTGQLALSGHWNDTFSYWQSTVENSILAYQNTRLQNDNAFNINIDLTNYLSEIEGHCWLGAGVSLCLPNQAIVGDTGDIVIELDVDLSAIDELLLPKDIELISQINGDIKAKWSEQKPFKATANFSLSSGYLKISDDFNEHQLSQWSQGDFSFTLDERWLTSNLLLTNTFDKALMKIDSSVELVNEFPVDAQIQLNQFNLQPFQSILADVISLQGDITAALEVDGTLDSPLINGEISLEKSKLQLTKNANIFDNISTTLSINNNQANLLGKFFIEEQEANLTGYISWKNGLALNIDLNAEALPLVFPPQLVMNVSPKLNFSLEGKALIINGNIDVLDGSYNIEKLPEGSVSLSDDVIIVDQHGKDVVKESTGFDIKTNIRVNIARAFEITGQGLQSHLFGQLQVNQQEKQPFQLFGRIQSNDGTFQAYGQKLQIEKGELTFNGPIDNPYFNLRAGRHIKAEDIDVGIQITGLADELDMQLFSSPTMDMPEMLSYLVRGRSLDSGTENSTAAASLLVGFGVTNSVGLFDQIEKIPLISNIAVDTEGEGDQTQATVSGYIGKRVYLKYGIGVYEPINELTVRMYMFNRFWLEIVSGIEQSTDLYYSFDID